MLLIIISFSVSDCTKPGVDTRSYPIDFCPYIFSMNNFLIEKQGGKLRLSADEGITWHDQWLDVSNIGPIRFIHVFSNNNLLICDDRNAYYSEDWITLSRSLVLDIDGNEYINKSKYHNFSTYHFEGVKHYVEGEEVRCWGNYSNEYDQNDNYIPKVWLAIDGGRTVKCIYDFSKSKTTNNPKIILPEHIHNVNFNPYDGSFWVQTGDSNSNSQWIKGVFNPLKNTFEWRQIGIGLNFKTTNMIFKEDYILSSLDRVPGGIFKVAMKQVGNPSARKMVFNTPNDCICTFMGEKGDILALIATYGGSYPPCNIFYSKNGKNFVSINTSEYLKIGNKNKNHRYNFYNCFDITKNGKLLVSVPSLDVKLRSWNERNYVWLDEVIYNATGVVPFVD